MGLSERRLKTLELAARMASPSSSTSLDIVRREFATTYLDALESKSLAPDTALEVSDRVEQGSLRVRMALERTLTEKERCVVAWRFGLRPEDRGRAPDALPMFTKRDKVRRQRQYADRSILEVADAVGLSGTRTNDILRSALQKLRTSHYAGELRESLNDFDAWGA
jgi:DNA-directed RNA polymerase sigma subunit (sigma70/sigma32)